METEDDFKRRLFNDCIDSLTSKSLRSAEDSGMDTLQTANNERAEICPHCGAEHSLLNVEHGKRLCSICGLTVFI
jgi:ribosomal protein S27AE